jgi:hypothetical protein
MEYLRLLQRNWLGILNTIVLSIICVHSIVVRITDGSLTLPYELVFEQSSGIFSVLADGSNFNFDKIDGCIQFDDAEEASMFVAYRQSWFFLLLFLLSNLLIGTAFYWCKRLTVEPVYQLFIMLVCDGCLVYMASMYYSLFYSLGGCLAYLQGISFIPRNLSWLFQVLNNGALVLSAYYLIYTLVRLKRFSLYLQAQRVKHAKLLQIVQYFVVCASYLARGLAIILPIYMVLVGSVGMRLLQYISFPMHLWTFLLIVHDFIIAFAIVFKSRAGLGKLLTKPVPKSEAGTMAELEQKSKEGL